MQLTHSLIAPGFNHWTYTARETGLKICFSNGSHPCRYNTAVEAMKEAEQDVKIAEFARSKEKTLVARKVHEQAKRDDVGLYTFMNSVDPELVKAPGFNP
jgi:hypothetical protein